MFESVFTPQAGTTGLNEGFPTTSSDNQFCRAQLEKTSFSDNPTIGELVKCPCRPFRANRNTLSFKVVEVSFVPPPVASNSLLRSGSPKLFA